VSVRIHKTLGAHDELLKWTQSGGAQAKDLVVRFRGGQEGGGSNVSLKECLPAGFEMQGSGDGDPQGTITLSCARVH